MTAVAIRLTESGLATIKAGSTQPGEGELVVATRAAALGPPDLAAPQRRTICAGFSGDVVEVGQNIDSDLIGARVAVLGHRACGRCGRCLAGMSTACSELGVRGQTIDGGLASAVLVRADEVLTLPDRLSHADAALMHRVATALHAIRRSPGRPGDDVAIVGDTPLALATGVVARAAGFGRVAVVHGHPACQDALADSGVRVVATPTDQAGWDDLRSWLDGYGPDVVFECAGTPQTRVAAIELTRPAGAVVMMANEPERVPMDINLLVMGDKRVRGAQAYTSSDARAALDLMARSQIDVSALVGATLDVNAFMAAARDNSIETIMAGCQATIVRWLPDTMLAE